MKSVIVLLLLFSALASATEPEVCQSRAGPYWFLSEWNDDDDPTTSLTEMNGTELTMEHGAVVYHGDLNGDGKKDFIFTSYSSQGSSRDSTFAVLIQCRGYLKFAGGEYFAKAEVPEGQPTVKGGYKDILFSSYKRDASSNIVYRGEEALVTPHLWRFNPQSQKYEGESE
ncbi:hypothetical protein [Pseudomonas fluorescens]|uniref:hypothetical protein n=1 Tax=Pseudomonas fluorescens TaxID=294 RepID=UPI003D225D8E